MVQGRLTATLKNKPSTQSRPISMFLPCDHQTGPPGMKLTKKDDPEELGGGRIEPTSSAGDGDPPCLPLAPGPSILGIE